MKYLSNKRLLLFDLCWLGLGTALWLYAYIGFFFPSAYILSYGKNPLRILWFIRITMPLLFIGYVLLVINVRSKKVDPRAVLLLVVVSSLCLYIGYGVADTLYQNWHDAHRVEYHPYLQLRPIDNADIADTASHVLKVFCLGGSTTQLTDTHGKDWPSRVDSILRTSYGRQDVRVYNCGREWYTSLHTLINFETNLRQHHPSAIIIMQSINDLLQNADFSYMSHGTFRDDYGHFYGPVNRLIDRRSLRNYIHDVVSELWYSVPRRVVTADHFSGLRSYERNMNTIIELARHDNIKVILMTEPFLVKPSMSEEEASAIGMIRVEAINDTMVWSSESVRIGMEQYNSTLKAIAARNGLPCIDLEKEVPKSLTYFRDEVHYRDTTFPIISRFIAAKLDTLLAVHAK